MSVRIGDHAGDAFQDAGHVGAHRNETSIAQPRSQAGFAGDQQQVLVMQHCGDRPRRQALAGIEALDAVGTHPAQAAVGIAKQQLALGIQRQRRAGLFGQADLALPLAVLVVQHPAFAGAHPGLRVVREQQRMQWLPGERGRQRDQRGVAGDRARKIDPIELPDRCRSLPRRGLQLCGAAFQQGAPQVVRLEVFTVAVHPSVSGAHQRAVRITGADRKGVHAARAEAVEAKIGTYPEVAFAVGDDRHRRGGSQAMR